MDLICPENRKVIKNAILGICAYNHEDDNTSCELMNRLNVNVDSILKNYVDITLFDDKTKAALLSSAESSIVILDALGQKTGKEFVTLLSSYMQLIQTLPPSQQSNFIRDIINRYGDVAIFNIKMVSGEDCFHHLSSRKKQYDKMYKVNASECSQVVLKTNEKKSDRRQQLSDILESFGE